MKQVKRIDNLNLNRLEKQFARVVSFGILIASSTRMFTYSVLFGEVYLRPGPKVLTDDGKFIVVYMVLWGVAAVFALKEFILGRIGTGLFFYTPLLFWWSLSYVMAWIESSYTSSDWYEAIIYFAQGLITLGFFGIYITIRRMNHSVVIENTEQLNEIKNLSKEAEKLKEEKRGS